MKKAILVGINVANDPHYEESFKELKGLAKALGFKIEGVIEQNIKTINKKFYIGEGKVESLQLFANEHNADVIIFNNNLTPLQNKSLEDVIHIEVIDRTILILNIFAMRAKTKEAKLQVEVARLNYLMPRLVSSNLDYEQQKGGGVHNRGAGEKQIDIDRRILKQKIARLENELDKLEQNRLTSRKNRDKNDIPLVCLAGYTNSGKSTLLNAMLEENNIDDEKQVFTKDMLFATLDTQTRYIKFKDNKSILLSDTVGFISDIPHQLIRAFKSTLEEIVNADLILLVADISNSEFLNQIDTTLRTLDEIGVKPETPILYVFNKSDKVGLATVNTNDDRVFISAKNRINLNILERKIKEKVFKNWKKCSMYIPFESASVFSYLKQNATILSSKQKDDGYMINVQLSPKDFNRFSEFVWVNSEDC